MKLTRLFHYPINYLIIFLFFYLIYDYFEHTTREGSTFEEHPWNWLLFSLVAYLSFVLIVLLIKKVIQNITGKKNLLIEVIAIGGWLSLYIVALGPLIDHLFWPFDQLNFRFSFGPFMIILGIYLVIRILINLLIGKSALYSK